MKRRVLLQAGAAAFAVPAAARAAAPRVLIVGAGWAGLAAAHTLRSAAPAAALTVFDREPRFRALPLSNAWLAGFTPERLPQVDLAQHAEARGWRFVHAGVEAIDRERRELHAAGARHAYDALLLASGAEPDFAAWFDSDRDAAALARTRWSAGYAAAELDALRQRLQAFDGGELLITVPPPPLRCPPAPYERALLLAQSLQRRGRPGRIVLLDSGSGMPRLNRLIAERHAERIEHRLHAVVQSVDPRARRIVSTDGERSWDEALLLPPMHAGALLRGAGLVAAGARFAAVHADTLQSPFDERIWLAGDALDSVSPLFGPYPKTAEVAADTGAAAALQLAAALRQRDAGPAALPRSRCHLWLQAEPPEQLLLDVQFRRRGDGVRVQTVRQLDNPQPRGEDLAWAQELLRDRLGL